MSHIAYMYYNELETLDLSELEILSDKIKSLIYMKKTKSEEQSKEGLKFFNGIKGSVKSEINADQELFEALEEKYENINWHKYYPWFNTE